MYESLKNKPTKPIDTPNSDVKSIKVVANLQKSGQKASNSMQNNAKISSTPDKTTTNQQPPKPQSIRQLTESSEGEDET